MVLSKRRVGVVLIAVASLVGSMLAPVTVAAETHIGVEHATAELSVAPAYRAVPVARVADTRGDVTAALQVPIGRLTPGVPLVLDLAGNAGIPDDGVAAVDLNVAVTAVARTGYLAVYPCADGDDGTARLNYTAPATGSSAIAVQVLAQLDVDGAVCIEASAPAHVIVDTSGYLADGGPLRPLAATRLFDTRTGDGAVAVKTAKPAVETPFPIEVAGVAGVPESGVSAVLLSVAAVKGTAPGFVSVYPCADGYQGTANLNHRATDPVANSVIAPLDENGEICFYNSASVDLVVDISAWFADDGGFEALEPTRVADTRDGVGDIPIGRLTPFEPLAITLAGEGGVPPTGVDAVSLNVAVARSTAAGFLAIFPCDEEWNGTASLNFRLGEPISNAALTPLAADGTACVLASSPVDVIIDVNGWFGNGEQAVDDEFAIDEDSGFNQFDVLANDVGTDTVTAVTQPANGSVAITNDGDDVRYIPQANYCNTGDEPDEFTYTAEPGPTTATVSVTVTCIDDAPSAVDDASTMTEDAATTSIDVLSNDTDVDGGPISIASVTQPGDGVATTDGATVAYTPDADACNDGSPTDDFTYTLAPGGGTATVSVTVTCVPDAPVAVDDEGVGFVIAEDDTPLTIMPLSNDTDVDGGPISIVAITDPANGTAEITNGGADLTYEPDPGYCNDGSPTDDFTYTLEPGGSTATIAMAVTCVNDAPLAVDDVFASDVTPGSANDRNAIGNTTLKIGAAAGTGIERVVAGSLLDNDTDGDAGQADADTLSVSDVESVGGAAPFTATTAEGGTVVVDDDGTFVFTPAPGFGSDAAPLPTDSFEYTITDGTATSTATATIEVSAPVWYIDSAAPAGGDGRSGSPFAGLDSLNGDTADVDDPGDTIFLYTGSVYEGGLPLQTGQRLIGEPVGLSADGTQLLAPNGGVLRPEITTTGSGEIGIELASGVLVDSVATRNTGSGPSGRGDGWSADGVGDISLHHVAHFGVGFHGFDIDGLVGDLAVTGTLAVFPAVEGTTSADAVAIAGSTPAASVTIDDLAVFGSGSGGVVIAGNAGPVTITDGSIHGNAGTGLSILTGSAAVSYGGTVGVPVSNDGAVSISGRQGTTTLTGAISDSGGAGVGILNTSSGSTVFSGAIDLNDGAGLHLVGNADGLTSFGGPVTITGGTGISVTTPASSTASTTFSEYVDVDITTETGVHVSSANPSAAVVAFEGGLEVDTTSGTAVSTSGGRLDIVDSTGQGETLRTTSGIVLSMNNTSGTIDLESVDNVLATGVGTVILDSVGSVDLGVATLDGQHVAGGGGFRYGQVITVDGATRFATDPASAITGTTVGSVNLANVTDLAFAAASLTSTPDNGGSGVVLTDIAAGTFAVSGQTSSVGGSVGVRVTRSAADVTMGSLVLGDAVTAFGTYGVVLDDVSGSVDIDGGAIQNALSRAVWVTGGSGAVSYAGTVAADTGHSVRVQDRASGLVEFTGLVSASGPASGVDVSNVSGGVSFVGGIDIVVSSSLPAFQAVGSAITVVSPAGGTNELSNTGGGAALVLTNSTIPVAGVTFDSVSAGGASGAVSIFGVDGPGALTLDGGAITGDTAANAFSLWNTTAPITISSMTVDGSAGRAVYAQNSADVTISDISITGFGGDAAIAAIANGTAGAFTLTASDGQHSTITQPGPNGRAVDVRNFGTTDMTAVVERLVTNGGATGVFLRGEGTGEFLATVGHPGADDPDDTTGGALANVTITDTSDVAVDLEIFASVSTRVLLDDVEHSGAPASTGGLAVDASAIGGGALLDLIVEDSTLQPTSGSGIDLSYDTSAAFETALDVLLRRVDVGGDGLTAEVANAAEMNIVATDSTFAGATTGAALTVPGPGGLAAAMCLDLSDNSFSGATNDVTIDGQGARYSMVDLAGSLPADVQTWLDASNDDGGDPGTALETVISDTGYSSATTCTQATAP
jgi:Bacterial cadherin-like domain/Cadherin-like domain